MEWRTTSYNKRVGMVPFNTKVIKIYSGLKLLMLEFAFISITQITLRITYKIGNKVIWEVCFNQ